MSYLVPELCIDQHFIQIDPQCIPQANNPHYYTICFRLWLVPFVRLLSATVSTFEKDHTSLE